MVVFWFPPQKTLNNLNKLLLAIAKKFCGQYIGIMLKKNVRPESVSIPSYHPVNRSALSPVQLYENYVL